MSTIRSGLTAVGLAALAVGTLAPAAAHAAPTPTPGADTSTTSIPAADASTSSTGSPHVRRIEAYGTRQFTVNGSAPGAQMVNIAIPGATGDVVIVRQGRFSSILQNEHLGKNAVITALGSDGRWSAPVEVALEPFLADGEADAPGTPVVHAVSRYDGDDHVVVEGTVTSDPLMFERPVVVAPSLGLVYDAADANGAFALRVPAEHAGETLEIRATRSGLESEAVAVELVETERNTASDVHPLEVASPTAGDVLTAPEATFAGSGIPNSQIVVTRDERTNRASSTLCETRVTSLGDWSCTSPTLPAGSYDTTISETPTWASAPKQERGTAFTVAENVEPAPETRDLTIEGDGTVSATGRTTLTGAGHPGSTVTLHPFGVGRGGEVSTEVRPDGSWSISRGFGPTTYTAAVFVQTGGPGADQSVPFPLDGTRTPSLIIDGDGTVSPTGRTTLTGTGDAGATVTLHPFGVSRGGEVSTEVRADGSWSISRGFGPTTYTAAVFVQTGGPGADQSVPFPLDGTRTPSLIIDGDGTVSPTGRTTLTGTGDAGATVTLHPFGQGRGGEVSTEVRADGSWSISRGFGPSKYNAAVFVQTGGPGADQSIPFPLDGTR